MPRAQSRPEARAGREGGRSASACCDVVCLLVGWASTSGRQQVNGPARCQVGRLRAADGLTHRRRAGASPPAADRRSAAAGACVAAASTGCPCCPWRPRSPKTGAVAAAVPPAARSPPGAHQAAVHVLKVQQLHSHHLIEGLAQRPPHLHRGRAAAARRAEERLLRMSAPPGRRSSGALGACPAPAPVAQLVRWLYRQLPATRSAALHQGSAALRRPALPLGAPPPGAPWPTRRARTPPAARTHPTSWGTPCSRARQGELSGGIPSPSGLLGAGRRGGPPRGAAAAAARRAVGAERAPGAASPRPRRRCPAGPQPPGAGWAHSAANCAQAGRVLQAITSTRLRCAARLCSPPLLRTAMKDSRWPSISSQRVAWLGGVQAIFLPSVNEP